MKRIDKNRIVNSKFYFKVSICIVAFLLISISSIYAVNVWASKGELNDDGEIDYADVYLLEMHLIWTLQKSPEFKLITRDYCFTPSV